MPFFHYRQNNSGGFFDCDDNVNKHVIIEATDAAHADNRAQEIGIYFDGVDRNIDCECCGDRWHEAYYDGDPTPQAYGETIEFSQLQLSCNDKQNLVIHCADGSRLYGLFS